MSETLRHLVGKTTLSGYLLIRAEDEVFFRPLPDGGARPLRLAFEGDQEVRARLVWTGGKERRLKLAYTGTDGAALRSWLKKRFPARKSSKYRGVLIFVRRSAEVFGLESESLSEAETEVLSLGPRRYLAGAQPLSVLHPAMGDLEGHLAERPLPEALSSASLQQSLAAALGGVGWEPCDSVGAGLALAAGLRRTGAQLHPVLDAADLYPAVLSLAAAFELRQIDLGVLLVADGRLAERLRRTEDAPGASEKRTLRELEQLAFLIRGPLVIVGLDVKRVLR